ncbi:hypothetical protein HDG37_007402 [Paraburkholderia sp. MM5384-R2]|nr:hypothetical protein [Paraburkholderia sp. MM5384-R2]
MACCVLPGRLQRVAVRDQVLPREIREGAEPLAPAPGGDAPQFGQVGAQRVRGVRGALAQEEFRRLCVIGDTERVGERHPIRKTSGTREPRRLHPGGQRREVLADGSRLGDRGVCLRFVHCRGTEAPAVLAQGALEYGGGGGGRGFRHDPQPSALPVFDRGVVLEQHREHGRVLALCVGERRAAAL